MPKKAKRGSRQPEFGKRSRQRNGGRGGGKAKAPAIEEPTPPEGPLDESRLGDVPQVRAIDPADFDRAVMICLNARGRDAAVRLAAWICAGLKSVAPKNRKGVAFVQIDEPLGDDLRAFEGNVFRPPESMVACLTGTRALANAMATGAFRASAGHAVGGGRFEHILRTVPVWAIVIDDSVIVTDEAYLAPDQRNRLLGGPAATCWPL